MGFIFVVVIIVMLYFKKLRQVYKKIKKRKNNKKNLRVESKAKTKKNGREEENGWTAWRYQFLFSFITNKNFDQKNNK